MQLVNEIYRLSRRRTVFFTCADRKDGAGAQILAHLSVQLLSRALGVTYAHSPFKKLDHQDAGGGGGKWEQRWEQLFELGKGHIEAAAIEAQCEVVKLHKKAVLMPELDPVSTRPILFKLHSAHFFADLLADHYYYLTQPLHLYLNKPAAAGPAGIVDIAVHIRRGDLVTRNIEYRIVTDAEVLAMLSTVKQVLDAAGRRYRVSLYSEGKEADFAEELKRGAGLYLDHDAQWTFLQLARSDVLICTKSAFSHVAGLVGNAWVICPEFWHTLPSRWLSYAAISADQGGLERIAQAGQGYEVGEPHFAEDLRPRPVGAAVGGGKLRIHVVKSGETKIKAKHYYDHYGTRTKSTLTATWIHHRKVNSRCFARYRIDADLDALRSLKLLYRAQAEVDALVLFNGKIVGGSEWFTQRAATEDLPAEKFSWTLPRTVELKAGVNSLSIIAISALPELAQFRLSSVQAE
ncbi:hypothetical protein [Hydrocarboniphaga sp.]|uniref:hypothetical protein n=1 Tax=Hydrocarboniphaga sp. TaxID=2033016 RepID=UPI002603C745|nr:hypothetical protein [Hydrocarboniphaga sp.]